MKKAYFIGSGLLLLAIGGFFYFATILHQEKPPQKPTLPVVTMTPTPVVSAESQSIEETTDAYSITIKYPKFSGITNTQLEDSINTLIKTKMQNDVTAFKKETVANTPPPDLKDAKAELQTTFTVVQAGPKYISVQFQVMDKQPGMAHPDNYNKVFNYDLTQEKEVKLTDLFKTDSNYLKILSNITHENVLSQQKDNPNAGDLVDAGTSAKLSNFALFTLSPSSLIINFNPASVAPSYMGTMKVSIPWNDIVDLLK